MITYISGGERSGKSSYGQDLACSKSESPVYLATAKIQDKDFEDRVRRHKEDRDYRWETIEEPINISALELEGKTVLVDCITLWLTNVYYAHNADIEKSLQFAKSEWNRFAKQDFEIIAISNEIGMGLHGTTREARKFVELQGWMNQHIASQAGEAWFMVSGIPIKIK